MFHQEYLVPSTDGCQAPVKAYIPGFSENIDPAPRRPAVVIFPGGGYSHLGAREAEPVALRFVALGFNAFVVTYRYYPHLFPKPQQDAAAVMAWVRRNCEALLTDPKQVAVIGFSAGGHLAASLGVMWQRAELWQEMGIAPEEVRPNAMVLGYPVLTAGPYANRSTFEHLTGSKDVADHLPLGIEALVTDKCPPTFLWHTYNDTVVPVENSMLMSLALSKHRVPAETHLYREGPHGAGLYSPWSSGPNKPQMNVPEIANWPELAAGFLHKVM